MTSPAVTARGPVEVDVSGAPAAGEPVSLALTVAGVRPRDLDAAVWGILGELGEFRVAVDGPVTRLRLEHTADRRPTP